jgi:hypothetical protein
MKKLTLSSVMAAVGLAAPAVITRAMTHDVAFPFRMGAGFAGDINRTHPFDVVAERQDVSDPITAFGNGCLMDTTNGTVRAIIAADQSDSTAINLYGVLVRPYPTQQNSTSQALGTGTPSTAPAILDILTEGLIMVKVVGTPTKRGPVYVWCTASTGSHVQGGFESAADAGDTVRVANAYFNGPPDANGIVEMRVWNQGA